MAHGWRTPAKLSRIYILKERANEYDRAEDYKDKYEKSQALVVEIDQLRKAQVRRWRRISYLLVVALLVAVWHLRLIK